MRVGLVELDCRLDDHLALEVLGLQLKERVRDADRPDQAWTGEQDARKDGRDRDERREQQDDLQGDAREAASVLAGRGRRRDAGGDGERPEHVGEVGHLSYDELQVGPENLGRVLAEQRDLVG